VHNHAPGATKSGVENRLFSTPEIVFANVIDG
jgi:hypothetical protein